MTHIVSCHCRRVRFEVDADLGDVVECNCSTCGRSGFLHWRVPGKAVRPVTEGQGLSTYVWRAAAEGQHFCPVCGVHMLRPGYADGAVSVNARCIEGIDVFTLKVGRFDGRTEMLPGPRD